MLSQSSSSVHSATLRTVPGVRPLGAREQTFVGLNWLPMNSNTLYVGDASKTLATFPDESVRCIITSPPYWGLRDYDVDGQIGAEADIEDYLRSLVDVFSEARRVLTTDGTFWLNIGDGYTSGGRKWRQADKKLAARGMTYRPDTPDGLKPKDLLGVPWRIAFALQADGWYLRSEIIWEKPNGNPESVRDRVVRNHETVFMLTKSERYHYDRDAVKEPTKDGQSTRNRRSVWSIPTEPYKQAHFATFPTGLVEPMLLAGTEPDDIVLDPFFGSGTTAEVALKHGRRFIGIELSDEYAEVAQQRLAVRSGFTLPVTRIN